VAKYTQDGFSPGLSFATFYNFRFWDWPFPEAHTAPAPVAHHRPIKPTDFITYSMRANWHANWL
jgi:hypothetical protein